jgi:(p)ppGpp synthase/HD superfamily hydrolase
VTAPLLGRRFADAMVYAWKVHRDQRRKGTAVPYVAHLLGVASLVLGDGGDEDEAIGALLHDAAEDQGGRGRLADIEGRFGVRVALIVEGCSDSLEEPKPPWRGRKDYFLRVLLEAPPEVVRVALADKLYNCRSIVADVGAGGAMAWGRFKAGPREQLWYYTQLLAVFRRTSPSLMVGQLADEIEALAALVERDSPGPV